MCTFVIDDGMLQRDQLYVLPYKAMGMPPWVVVADKVNRRGGFERANYALIKRLTERGIPVRVICFEIDGDLEYHPCVTALKIHRIFRPDILAGQQLHHQAFRLVKAVVKREPDVLVLVNGGNCAWPAINWVHFVYDSLPRYPDIAPPLFKLKNRLHRRWARHNELKSFRRAYAAIAVSERIVREVRQVIPQTPITLIRPGSDESTIPIPRAIARAFYTVGSSFVIAFIGGLGFDDRKNLRTVLLSLSKQTALNFVLLIAGTGHAEAFWKRQVAAFGLNERVRFLGFCDDIPRLLAASDLLLAPSHYEPYGIAMHEAVTSGVPVITTRQCGFAELYSNELDSFMLNDPDDADELLGKLLSCHAEPERTRSAFSTLGHRLRRYTWNAMADNSIEYCLACWQSR
jgi:glycosyltransferase involved in cell wall biosynthesis